MKIAYFHLMKGDPAAIAEAAPRHHRYWRGRELEGYSGDRWPAAVGLGSGALLNEAVERHGCGVHRTSLEKPYPEATSRPDRAFPTQ